MLDREQFCSKCGDPTGRAGNFHEHLFVKINGELEGPLCDECAESLAEEHDTEIIRK